MSFMGMQCVVYQQLLSGVEMLVPGLNTSRILGCSLSPFVNLLGPLEFLQSLCVLNTSNFYVFLLSDFFCHFYYLLTHLCRFSFFFFKTPQSSFLSSPSTDFVLHIMVERACTYVGVALASAVTQAVPQKL